MSVKEYVFQPWKRIAKDLTVEEAKAYISIVKRSRDYNERKDAKYIKGEIQENKLWSVYCTSDFNALSEDEIKIFINRGEF
jgi:hypothetical protein